MSFYYSAIDDNDAIRANDVQGGPCPDTSDFPSIHEQSVMASPHLWELTAIANGTPYRDCTSELVPVWPAGECSTAEPIAQFIQRLPDTLRDDLADIDNTPEIAATWAKSVWGMQPDQATKFINEVRELADQARSVGEHLYWWSSL
ncbi:hypothetical protein G7A66_13565 [Altererythrobacter sp. SALINAS58]|uniref:hypothetical protein n=1 Tax=Alteripontixanthobacter muriae TaxID=2705546 RepID=UPI001577499E|nr:hypothetical protein [Alteripontixanthobacter muriae]NTZ44088.1 hypothetical protein [Alteripontixanthobacter muriae]